jgi:hypothetical protein
MSKDALSGYLIIDFPKTREGAEAFEKIVNGFVPDAEKPSSEFYSIRQNTERVNPSPPEIPEPSALTHSALTWMILLKAQKETCQARAIGWLVDPTTGDIYHPKFNPPPEDVKGLAERLEPVEHNVDELNIEIDAYNDEIEGVIKTFKFFGVEADKIPLIVSVDANEGQENVYEKVKEGI